MRRRFGIAPMSAAIVALTTVALAVPTSLVLMAVLVPRASGLGWLAGFIAAIYVSVWLFWRPGAFELHDSELIIVFPLRRRGIPLRELGPARRLDRHALTAELGFRVRIGAGGLFGAFGWLWTSRRGLVECYVTRLDEFLLVERSGARPLLLTPDEPASFAEAIGG